MQASSPSLLGFIIIAIWPIYRVAELHLTFITGFNFIAFTVAIRVVFGHSGQVALLSKKLWFFIATGALLYLAMLSRSLPISPLPCARSNWSRAPSAGSPPRFSGC